MVTIDQSPSSPTLLPDNPSSVPNLDQPHQSDIITLSPKPSPYPDKNQSNHVAASTCQMAHYHYTKPANILTTNQILRLNTEQTRQYLLSRLYDRHLSQCETPNCSPNHPCEAAKQIGYYPLNPIENSPEVSSSTNLDKAGCSSEEVSTSLLLPNSLGDVPSNHQQTAKPENLSLTTPKVGTTEKQSLVENLSCPSLLPAQYNAFQNAKKDPSPQHTKPTNTPVLPKLAENHSTPMIPKTQSFSEMMGPLATSPWMVANSTDLPPKAFATNSKSTYNPTNPRSKASTAESQLAPCAVKSKSAACPTDPKAMASSATLTSVANSANLQQAPCATNPKSAASSANPELMANSSKPAYGYANPKPASSSDDAEVAACCINTQPADNAANMKPADDSAIPTLTVCPTIATLAENAANPRPAIESTNSKPAHESANLKPVDDSAVKTPMACPANSSLAGNAANPSPAIDTGDLKPADKSANPKLADDSADKALVVCPANLQLMKNTANQKPANDPTSFKPVDDASYQTMEDNPSKSTLTSTKPRLAVNSSESILAVSHAKPNVKTAINSGILRPRKRSALPWYRQLDILSTIPELDEDSADPRLSNDPDIPKMADAIFPPVNPTPGVKLSIRDIRKLEKRQCPVQ